MHFFVSFFLPHSSNDHRARILHNKSLLFILVFLCLFQLAVFIIKAASPHILGVTTEITIEQLLYETNKMRTENGLLTLSFDEELSKAAKNKAQDMFSHNYWAHNAPDGTTPWVFIKEANYIYAYAGENLAKDFSDSEDIVQAWMDSPRHRDNVLSKNYADIGFAVVSGKLNGKETTLVVQMFGKRTGPRLAKSSSSSILDDGLASSDSSLSSSPSKNALVNGVARYPLFDVNQWSRNLATSTAGVLIFVLAIDLMIIKRRRIVRLTGHNFDHILFLSGPLLISFLGHGGSVL